MDFQKAYQIGQIGEIIAHDYLTHKSDVRQVVDVRDDCRIFKEQDVDFLVETTDRKFWKIEVKTDQQAHQTGNIAYETLENGKIGCFEKTTADIVMYYTVGDDCMYWIKMPKLKEYVKEQKYELVNMGKNSKGYLVPIKELREQNIAYLMSKTFYKHKENKSEN